MSASPKKYKYWVEYKNPNTHGTKNAQDKTWEELIDFVIGFVSAGKLHEIEAIKFFHPEAPFGTANVDGSTMLDLWKEIDKKKPAKLAP